MQTINNASGLYAIVHAVWQCVQWRGDEEARGELWESHSYICPSKLTSAAKSIIARLWHQGPALRFGDLGLLFEDDEDSLGLTHGYTGRRQH
jgi:hypothetical protein